MTKDIRTSFIVSDDHYKGNIEEVAEKTIKHGKITENGNFIIENKNLSQDDITRLCLVIRYIAHEFNENITATVRPIDLSEVLKERIESTGSRLSLLARNGFAKKEGRGQYKVQVFKINSFLESISGESNNKNNIQNTKKRKDKKLTGIGLDIHELITESFFKTPKLVNEVAEELQSRAKYHQTKVIDTTIRNVFVRSRKSLKRIPNNNGGKAKWLYVTKN